MPRDKLAAARHARSEAILDRAQAELKGSGIRYTREVLTGPVGHAIAAHAELTGCDAIVMGRYGETGIGELLMGSVAMKVLHLSRLPVMLVR